jgi:hypothetical protein
VAGTINRHNRDAKMKSITIGALLVLATSGSAQVTRIPTSDKPLAGTPTQLFAIGAEDGEDWELLSRVSGVSFDARDNLYVLDAGNSRVLVFDAKGKFVRKIGKKGAGPGELISPVGLALTKDGYVAVTDLGRAGVSLFKTDGSFVKNIMLGDSLGFPAIQNGTLAHPTAGVVIRGTGRRPMMRADNTAQLGAPTGPRESPIMWLPVSGAARKLHAITLPSVTPKVTEGGGGNSRQVSIRFSPPAFDAQVLWGVLPSGTVAVADETAYRVKLISNGNVTSIIERPFAARKVTERDKDRAREQRRENMKSGRGMIMSSRTTGPGGSSSSISTGASAPRMSNTEIEQQIREMTFAETIPLLQSLYVDPKGRLWIERTARDVGEDGPIDIIDASGRYIGTVSGKMPDAVSVSGRAAYIERDDMDVEKVVVRKLPGGWF